MTKRKSVQKLNSGTSGLVVPVPKYLFPKEFQDASRLTYYASFFNSIEINSSFYKLPMGSTLTKWLQQVPEDFKFTFKLWKEITHVKELNFKEKDVEQFFKIISQANAKKGCLLVQFPPSLTKSYLKQVVKLLEVLKKYNSKHGWNIAVEFRSKTWYEKKIYKILKSYAVSLVLQDIPKSATPMITQTSKVVYVRFHGPKGNYRESYPDYFLSEYSTYIKEWLEEGKEVYVYFNNTMGDAFKNLQTLNKFCIDKQ